MLCHTELKESHSSGFCWNMDDRNEVSEFIHLGFDVMLKKLSLPSRAGWPFCSRQLADKKQWQPDSWELYSKKQEHFLSKHLDFSVWGMSQVNPQHRALLLTLTHIYTVYESSKITPEQTVINNRSWLVKKATRVQGSTLLFTEYTQENIKMRGEQTLNLSVNLNI